MNLNERAAKCMGGETVGPDPRDGSSRFPALWVKRTKTCVHHWNPAGTDETDDTAATPGDYNHARMLYERVVERGLRDYLLCRLGEVVDRSGVCLLDLTAAQLTLACCEVLEQHDDTD